MEKWFTRLPEGLDTWIGAHGGAVSGGECQRIGIARALIVAHHPEQVHGLSQVRLTHSNRPRFGPAADESQLTTSHYRGGS